MPKLELATLFYNMCDDNIDKEFFIEQALLWEFHPITRNDKIIALFVTKDNRIHCACLKEYRGKWFPKKMFNNLMSKIINKYGSIETTTTEATKQFVERLGFKEISRNEFKINYIKTEV